MSDYALRVSEVEQARYRMMAETAAAYEAAEWKAAGVALGAVVADVGCGPGAVLAVLADAVGPTGRADGIDGDPEAVAAANAAVAALPQASAREGAADATGLPERAYDVVMCRHVLAHNGPREQAIVDHLAALAKPGGSVYLVDVDGFDVRTHPELPGWEDLSQAYRDFHARRGNDLLAGRRLGALLEAAGLEVERYQPASPVIRIPPGLRPPSWAARDAMLAEAALTQADIERWEANFAAVDQMAPRPWLFVSAYLAIGRKPAA